MKAAYPAIKSAEPSATVVLGGLTGNDYEFLSQLYADGAKGSFDAVAVHTDTICDVESPYEILRNGQTDPRINRWSFLGYRTVHEVMLAHGDGSPIWMTELGWSTDTSVCNSGAWAGQKPAGVSPQQQPHSCCRPTTASRRTHTCRWASGSAYRTPNRSAARVAATVCSTRACNPSRPTGRWPTTTATAIASIERCGGQQGPTVKLMSPKTGVRYSNTLPISVTASDSAKVYQISLYDEGHIIRSFYVHGGLPTLSGHMVWYGARLLKPGKHTLTAKAFDERNNTSTTSITIVRTAKPKKHKRRGHKH